MERKWKERYSQKVRRRAVARTNACDNIVRLSRELGISRSLLYKWRYRLEPPDAQVEGVSKSNCSCHWPSPADSELTIKEPT